MSVMGSDDSTGYIAESPDPQWPRFELKGGGATTAMNFSWWVEDSNQIPSYVGVRESGIESGQREKTRMKGSEAPGKRMVPSAYWVLQASRPSKTLADYDPGVGRYQWGRGYSLTRRRTLWHSFPRLPSPGVGSPVVSGFGMESDGR